MQASVRFGAVSEVCFLGSNPIPNPNPNPNPNPKPKPNHSPNPNPNPNQVCFSLPAAAIDCWQAAAAAHGIAVVGGLKPSGRPRTVHCACG